MGYKPWLLIKWLFLKRVGLFFAGEFPVSIGNIVIQRIQAIGEY